MEVQLRDLTKNEANLTILGGDIGVLYIIQDELLRSPSTEFAGVIKDKLRKVHINIVGTFPSKAGAEEVYKIGKHINSISRGEYEFISVELAKAIKQIPCDIYVSFLYHRN